MGMREGAQRANEESDRLRIANNQDQQIELLIEIRNLLEIIAAPIRRENSRRDPRLKK